MPELSNQRLSPANLNETAQSWFLTVGHNAAAPRRVLDLPPPKRSTIAAIVASNAIGSLQVYLGGHFQAGAGGASRATTLRHREESTAHGRSVRRQPTHDCEASPRADPPEVVTNGTQLLILISSVVQPRFCSMSSLFGAK
jgi:hypothetical protein